MPKANGKRQYCDDDTDNKIGGRRGCKYIEYGKVTFIDLKQ